MRHLLISALVLVAIFAPLRASAEALSGFITETLAPGSTGDEVRLLQTWLSENTGFYPEGKITGEYGPATARAVKRYQESKGMVLQVAEDGGASGIVGPMTRANLNIDFSNTQGGIATVEAKYGSALTWDGKKFIPLVETTYLANRPIEGRLNVWFYPMSIPQRETPLLTVGEYAVGISAEGYLYAKSAHGTANAKLTRLVREEWQHLSVLFTKTDVVFISDNTVSETVPLTRAERFFFSGFFDNLFSPFQSFSFFFQPKSEIVPEPQAEKIPQTDNVFSSLVSFLKRVVGVEEESVAHAPSVEEETTEATPTASSTSEDTAPKPVAVTPAPSKKPAEVQKLAPDLFAPATTTIVTPVSSTSLPVGSIPSITASSSTSTTTKTATSTSNTATSTSSTTAPAVSLGGGAPSAPSNTAPVITVSGSAMLSIATGSVYTDPGVTATDAEDGTLTSSVVATGTVNHLIPGDYSITYSVSDSAGLSTTATRVVTVTPPAPLSPEAQATVYPFSPAGQEVSFSLSSGSGQNPKFVNVTISPLHVYVGDTQTMTVIVESPGGVASVQAVTQLDTTTLVLNLAKTADNGDRATFSASWVVYDTHVRTYRTTFTATAVSGATNSTTMAWSDPCSGVTQNTNSTLGANCTVSAVDGLDGATLTIPANTTLTINSGGIWAFNPGTSIIIDGTLSKGTGGQIKKGYLFYSGATNAEANTSQMYFFDSTPQTGYVRVNQYTQSSYQSYYELKYCFSPETPILMADGSEKLIKDIRLGDTVMGQDTSGKRRPNIVTRLFHHGPEEHGFVDYEVLRINGEILVTREHPFYTERGWVNAGDLKVGDVLFSITGKKVIDSIELGSSIPWVYNFTSFPDHTYFAGGILVHNKSGQCTFC